MIIQSRDESVPISLIERAVALSRNVGRIVVGGRMFGTGFLVSPAIVVTCHHLVPDGVAASSAGIEFDYRDDGSGAFPQVTQVAFDPTRVLADPQLDCAILGLASPLADRPAVLFSTEIVIGQAPTIIHHPHGGPMRIAFRDGRILSVSDVVIRHTTSTLPGSGGAPLFDEGLRLLGVHHASRMVQGVATAGGPIDFLNEAISIDAIVRLMRASGLLWLKDVVDQLPSTPIRIVQPSSPVVPLPHVVAVGPSIAPPAATEAAHADMPQQRSSVFISYAHDDQPDGEWRERLNTYLSPFRDQFDVWDDSRIRTGADWRGEINLALKRARVAVLLVGPHFLASDFIKKNELPPLLDAAKHASVRILPIITQYCLYQHTTLGRFQAFNAVDKALESLNRPEQNRVLTAFAEEIVRAISDSDTSGSL